MLLTMTGSQVDTSMGSVSSKKYSIIVVDKDNSAVSKSLVSYLGTKHIIKDGNFTDDQIKTFLYYQRISDYIVIPEGFGEAFEKATKSGNQKDMSALLESTYDEAMPRGIFINMQINEYLNAVADYINLGSSLDEASAKADSSLDINRFVKMQKQEIKDFSKIYNSFLVLPFGILTILFSGVLSVVISFNEKEKKNRTLVSSTKMTTRNIALVLGTLTIAVIVTSLLITIATFNQSTDYLFTNEWWLSTLNAFIYTISTTMLLSMITSLPLGINKTGSAGTSSFITCIIGLAFSFLGGTFVDLTILGEKVAVIGRFIPNYWYSTAIHKIWFDSADFSDLAACYGFQILFGFVCLSIGLVFTKFFGNKGTSN
jgi:ABC-type multidrug transport system permease subunit